MKSNPFGLNKNTPRLSGAFLRDGYSIMDKAFPFDEGILI